MKKIIHKILYKLLYALRFDIEQIIRLAEVEKSKQYKNNILRNIRCKGDNIYFNGKVTITHPLMVSIGNNVHIGDGAFLYTDGGLIIGDNTHISRNLTLYTSNHSYEGKMLPYDEGRIQKAVYISRNVWIGMNVCITPGITIGEGAIIGMGAVISSDVPPYSIVGNQPYRILKNRNVDYYKLIDNKKLYGGINGKKIEPKKNLRNAFDLDSNLFFIVTTGRSGSTSLAKILSTNGDIRCEHESKGILIRLSTEYEHGMKSREEIKNELVKIYSNITNIKHIFYGESDQKLSNLIDILHEIFPKAKFIWLIRNAQDVITSTYSRGWFHDAEYGFPVRDHINVDKIFSHDIYSQFRLDGSKIQGQFSLLEWKEMSPFERNCWYWVYWNSRIDSQLQHINKDQYIKVRLETIHEDIHKITSFIGAVAFKYDVSRYNEASYPMNDWTQSQMETFTRICQPYIDKWY